MKSLLKVTNISSVVLSLILPIIFLIGSFFYQYVLFGRTIWGIGIFLIYFLLTTVGFWGSLIQGIRSIANGKSKTVASAAVFQLIMYVSHMLVNLYLMFWLRNSSDETLRGFLNVFTFIFIFMIVLAIIRFVLAKKFSGDGEATTASPRLAGKIVLFCIVVPVVFTALIVFIYKFLESHPDVSRVLGIAVAIIIMLVIGGAVMFFFSRIPNTGIGGVSSPSPAPRTPAVKAAPKKDDSLANELADLEKMRKDLLRHWEECRKNNWDALTCINYGVTSEADFINNLRSIDAKIENIKKRM